MKCGENLEKFKTSLKLKQKTHHTQAYELKKKNQKDQQPPGLEATLCF